MTDELGVEPIAATAGLDVAHRWLGNTVWPLLGQDELARLHRSPLGRTEEEWRAALIPALTDLYRRAYPYAEAYETASSAASGFAVKHGYSEAEAKAYGESYAAMNTDANQRVHAEANARAVASLAAKAFTAGDVDAYAQTRPGAMVRACIAVAGPEARDRLATGLRDALSP
ncbi:hypothetical protein [Kutzneria sp. NPDC052558]|uniref:hypothetical protein n=1 Tax=Kutzneria sp. NPDC052558 TaxID=3364121 RepID=UPI0037C71364